MLALTPILAAVDPTDFDALKNSHQNSTTQIFGTDVTIVLWVLLALTAILFFWAFFLRKKPTHARGSLVVDRVDNRSSDSNGSTGRRKRRRRSDSSAGWGRNPTLSETGGLPPPRPEEPETPASKE